MFIDYNLRLSDKQTITVSTNSTNYVDTVQAGWGVDDEVYARFLVGTAFAGTAASSVTFVIQIAQDTAFASAVNVLSYAVVASTLTAAKVPLVAKLPAGMANNVLGISGGGIYQNSLLSYRYLRAYYTVTVSGSLTAGTITCDLVKNSSLTVDRIL